MPIMSSNFVLACFCSIEAEVNVTYHVPNYVNLPELCKQLHCVEETITNRLPNTVSSTLTKLKPSKTRKLFRLS